MPGRVQRSRDDTRARGFATDGRQVGGRRGVGGGCLGEDNDDGEETDPEEWEDVDEIVLEGFQDNWLGVEPQPIEGVENPTLVLFDGREYDLTWENMDGMNHNVQLLAGDEVLEETEQMGEEGDSQTLTFEATSEMDEYVCEPHLTTMVGDIEVHDE